MKRIEKILPREQNIEWAMPTTSSKLFSHEIRRELVANRYMSMTVYNGSSQQSCSKGWNTSCGDWGISLM
jgi:hypothetical protein